LSEYPSIPIHVEEYVLVVPPPETDGTVQDPLTIVTDPLLILTASDGRAAQPPQLQAVLSPHQHQKQGSITSTGCLWCSRLVSGWR
jgi:hypothetical protein